MFLCMLTLWWQHHIYREKMQLEITWCPLWFGVKFPGPGLNTYIWSSHFCARGRVIWFLFWWDVKPKIRIMARPNSPDMLPKHNKYWQIWPHQVRDLISQDITSIDTAFDWVIANLDMVIKAIFLNTEFWASFQSGETKDFLLGALQEVTTISFQ